MFIRMLLNSCRILLSFVGNVRDLKVIAIIMMPIMRIIHTFLINVYEFQFRGIHTFIRYNSAKSYKRSRYNFRGIHVLIHNVGITTVILLLMMTVQSFKCKSSTTNEIANSVGMCIFPFKMIQHKSRYMGSDTIHRNDPFEFEMIRFNAMLFDALTFVA